MINNEIVSLLYYDWLALGIKGDYYHGEHKI